jgi:heat shock protein HtpX
VPTLYDEIAANKLKSWLFVALFFVLIVLVVYFASIVFFGVTGVSLIVIAAVLAILTTVFSYWYSDRIVIALSHARPADERAHAHYVNVVEGLALAAGIPRPRAFVIEDDAINALATGRDPAHAAVCVTTGALHKLKRAELEGVVAHELAHVKNYDVRLATIAAVMAGFVIILSDVLFRGMLWGGGGSRNREGRGGGASGAIMVVGIIFLILSPIFATLIKAALSRKRESLADVDAAMLTRYPDGLIGALRRIRDDSKGSAVAHPSEAISHLYFANPLSGKALAGYFATHPPLDERIATLERYALEKPSKK